MDERRAREVTLLESLELADPPHEAWLEDDRAWADRVARESWRGQAEAARGGRAARRATLEGFAAERARHALHRLGDREPRLVRALLPPGATAWRSGALLVALVVAFALGVAADAIGASRHVNLLAPPFWGVLGWNLVVYVLLVAWPLVRVARGRRAASAGPFGRWAETWAGHRPRTSWAARGPVVHAFATRWSARTRGLSMLRGETLLHAGAAALALGLIAGLYARGLVLDYRAVWESTLLDAERAHALVATAFAPAAWLTGIAPPELASASAFAALRTEAGQAGGGAPAAPWLHLMATTLALGVVLPRVLLALGCALAAGWRSRHVALPLDAPYYRRLAALVGGRAARIDVRPYAMTPTPQVTLALQALAAAAFEPLERYAVAPGVPFGEDEGPLAPDPGATQVLALFDLAATPEPEHHGRFLERLRAALPEGATLHVLVDGSAFVRRFAGMPERLAERRAAWTRFAQAAGQPLAIVDLGADAPSPADVAALRSVRG